MAAEIVQTRAADTRRRSTMSAKCAPLRIFAPSGDLIPHLASLPEGALHKNSSNEVARLLVVRFWSFEA
jgi:hypothetical protein